MGSMGKKALAWLLNLLLIAGCCLTMGLPKTIVQAVTDDGFSYQILKDGTAEITYYYGSDAELAIPVELDGYTVSSIGENSFSGHDELISAIIPDSVTKIKAYAFFGCNNLTNITIPESVTYIGIQAISACDSLTHIILPDSVAEIDQQAFSYCENLTSISIPDGVTSINNYVLVVVLVWLMLNFLKVLLILGIMLSKIVLV